MNEDEKQAVEAASLLRRFLMKRKEDWCYLGGVTVQLGYREAGERASSAEVEETQVRRLVSEEDGAATLKSRYAMAFQEAKPLPKEDER